jgi:hypothetical protein
LPIGRSTLIGAALLAAFAVGCTLGALALTRTTTRTTTIYATTTTGLPAGCRHAITLTHRLELTARPAEIPQLTQQFEAAAAGCVIPAACKGALSYFPRIATVHTRAGMLDLAKAFDSAVADCEQ